MTTISNNNTSPATKQQKKYLLEIKKIILPNTKVVCHSRKKFPQKKKKQCHRNRRRQCYSSPLTKTQMMSRITLGAENIPSSRVSLVNRYFEEIYRNTIFEIPITSQNVEFKYIMFSSETYWFLTKGFSTVSLIIIVAGYPACWFQVASHRWNFNDFRHTRSRPIVGRSLNKSIAHTFCNRMQGVSAL